MLLEVSLGGTASLLLIAEIVAAAMAGSLALLWLGGIFWVANDVRLRTRDTATQWACTGAAALFFVPGLLAYLLLRPRETMLERAERQHESALIERHAASVPVCDACRRTVREDYVRCPYCAATLGSNCDGCGRANRSVWVACPYCGAAKTAARTAVPQARPYQTRPAHEAAVARGERSTQPVTT